MPKFDIVNAKSLLMMVAIPGCVVLSRDHGSFQIRQIGSCSKSGSIGGYLQMTSQAVSADKIDRESTTSKSEDNE